MIKVGDFGLVRAVSSAGTTSSSVILGTVAYLSPEQVTTGNASGAGDVYSAGILLYEMLTGVTPYTGDNPLSIAYRHVNDDVPAPSQRVAGLPPALDELVVRATRRDPATRPADGAAFLAELMNLRTRAGPAAPARPGAGADDPGPHGARLARGPGPRVRAAGPPGRRRPGGHVHEPGRRRGRPPAADAPPTRRSCARRRPASRRWARRAPARCCAPTSTRPPAVRARSTRSSTRQMGSPSMGTPMGSPWRMGNADPADAAAAQAAAPARPAAAEARRQRRAVDPGRRAGARARRHGDLVVHLRPVQHGPGRGRADRRPGRAEARRLRPEGRRQADVERRHRVRQGDQHQTGEGRGGAARRHGDRDRVRGPAAGAGRVSPARPSTRPRS